jgi:hypothetical protein
MATYAQIQAITRNETLLDVLRRALHKAATDIINEDAGTANHTARLKWANKWRERKVGTPISLYAELLMDNATLQGEITVTDGVASWASTTQSDNDIQFVVNGLVNTFAAMD